MGIMLLFPDLLEWFRGLLGIESNMNALYILCFAFIIMILMTLTSIVSRQILKIRILIQEISILEKRVRDLETDRKQNLPEDNNAGKEQKTGSN